MFSDKLKELRKLNNETQEELSNVLDVKQATYSSWETGRTEPSLDQVKIIAEHFKVSVDYLLDINKDELEQVKVILREQGILKGEDLTDDELKQAIKFVEFLKKDTNE